jgi:hypothetical protein
MNPTVALRNTVDLLTILESVGVPAWVQDGTLLGLVRDGRLIPWDHDTDTGCMIADWKPEARDALEAAGFALRTLGEPDNGWQHRWSRGGEKTDIFFHYPHDGGQWHAAYMSKAQYRFNYPRLSFERLRVLDRDVLIPSPPESFLETKYGADWRKPRRKWHFARDPVNGQRA